MFIFQALFFHQLLAKIGLFPAFFRAFVAADVKISAREQSAYFSQYVVQKLKSFFGWAEYFFKNAPFGSGFIRAFGAAQFGISRQRSECVSGHFNFRNNGNKTLAGIFHHLFYFFLGIKTAVFFSVVFDRTVAVMPHNGLFPAGGDGLQFRVFFYFNAPSLVFGEVPVECIEFVKRE